MGAMSTMLCSTLLQAEVGNGQRVACSEQLPCHAYSAATTGLSPAPTVARARRSSDLQGCRLQGCGSTNSRTDASVHKQGNSTQSKASVQCGDPHTPNCLDQCARQLRAEGC